MIFDNSSTYLSERLALIEDFLDRWLRFDALDTHANVALTKDDETVSESAFKKGILAWANTFKENDAHRVALFTENTLDAIQALLGAWRVGVHVYLLPDSREKTLENVLSLAPIDHCLFGLNHPSVPTLLAPNLTSKTNAAAQFSKNEPLLTLLTSGSTGHSKSVHKTIEQLLIECISINELNDEKHFFDSIAGAHFVSTVTHQHFYGLIFRVLLPLLAGGILTEERHQYPETYQASLRLHRSIFITSPTHLKRLEAEPSEDGILALAGIVSSTGPLDDESALKANAYFGAFPLEIYGSTETGAIGWRQRLLTENTLKTPLWQPSLGTQLSVTASGLLAVSGAFQEKNGFQTSDRVKLSQDGFELLGREDRILKVEGKRVSVDALETAIARWANTEKSLVRILKLNEGRRESIAAVITITPSLFEALIEGKKHLLVQSLRKTLATEFETVLRPRQVRFVSSLPQNTQGKITQEKLLALFESKETTWWIQNQSAQSLTAYTQLSPQLGWFKGHFDVFPILPGVAQLVLLKNLAMSNFPVHGQFSGVKQLKFKSIIEPKNVLLVQMTYREQEVRFVLSRYTCEHQAPTVLSQGTLFWKD